jgi:A/G-specific adenine glycosylase
MAIRSPSSPGSGRGRPKAPVGTNPDPGTLPGPLEAWFPAAARALPWRERRSGYHALVSEVMLQQTQVARVVEAFRAFVARFPGPAELAAAPEHEVLALWQGLGYYRRARHLHAAARAVCERHGGEVPADAASLRALPGIGRYTAGAISSIAFGRREPIVDGNVLRVLSRAAGRATRVGDPADERWAWEQAGAFVAAARDPAVANEALMELGATVCTPAAPRCGECPLAARCAARAAGTAGSIPAPRRAAARRTLHWHALVDADAEGLLLEPRPDRGLWAGMLQPPTVEADAPLGAAELARRWGAPVREAGAFVHVTSHRDVSFRVFVRDGGPAPSAAGARRVSLDALGSVPLSNAAWRAFECAGLPVRTPPSARPARRARSARSGS